MGRGTTRALVVGALALLVLSACAPSGSEKSEDTTSTSTTSTTTTSTTTTTTTLPPTTTTTVYVPPSPPVTAAQSNCDPNYSGCVPIASDVDCAGGSGNGPAYTGQVNVIGSDIYDLDADGDGIACE